MPNASLPDYVKRVFRLYLTVSSAGMLSLLVAILFASPQMQSQYGPYAWVLMLAIFLGCAVWVTTAEFSRYRVRRRFMVRVAMSATFTIKVLNSQGDAALDVYREIENKGVLPIKDLPAIKVGLVNVDADNPPQLSIRTNPPHGKTMKLLSHYNYREDGYFMYAWDYQIPEGLEGGERIIYTYELPVVPQSEADAFTEEGAIILIGSKVELYSYMSCNILAPEGYKIISDGVTVKDEFQNINRAESMRITKLCAPQIPPDRLGSALTWKIIDPLFRHEYCCRYRLVPRQ